IRDRNVTGVQTCALPISVVGPELDAGGQELLDLRQRELQRGDDASGVLAAAHEDDPLHQVVVVVAPEDAEPDGVADPDLADVPDADRRPLLRGDHDVLDVAQATEEPDAAHRQRVLALRDVAAAGVGVVGRHRVEHLLEGEVVAAQTGGIDVDLVLLGAAAPGDDVGDAGDLAELALEHPVLDRLELDERHRLRLQRVAEDLADHAREWSQGRLGVHRQIGLGDALLRLLPGPVVVGAVGEEDLDVREPEERIRAQKRHVGDAVELVLERNRDEPLDLFGGVTGPERDHLDLDVADVRIGLDRQPVVGDDARRRQHQGEGQRDEALVERERDEPVDHRVVAFNRMLPAPTTRSSGPSPVVTSTASPRSSPSTTGRRSSWSLPFTTRTKVALPSRWTALCGMVRARVAPVAMATLTNISALSVRPRLTTTDRTFTVRVSLSTASLM